MGGKPPQGRAARLATMIATALVSALCIVPAAQAVPQKQAEQRALRALGVQRGDDPVIVFRLDRTVRPGARIVQAGTARRPHGGRVEETGVVSSRTPAIDGLRLDGERAYFFYADLGPFQAYEHPGRVALVGRRSGRVRVSGRLGWPPLIDGRLPAFMRTANAYHDRDNWVLYRPWREGATASAQENRGPVGLPMLDPPLVDMAERQRVADLLAAERACVVRFSDTLGDFYDFGKVDRTRGWLGATFARLEDLNAGVSDRRYVLRSGMTPMAFAENVIRRRGCRDVLIYLAGGAWSEGEPAVTVGIKPDGAQRLRQQFITAQQVRSLIRAHRGTTFEVVVDAPYAGGFRDTLIREGNALVVATASGSRSRNWSYLPEVAMPGGQLRRHPGNPYGLLEFTNRALFGLERLQACRAEVEQGAAAQAEGRSFLAWMIERAFALGADRQYTGAAGAQTTCPSAAAANRRPSAAAASVSTDEDTALAIALRASDPDGDALTYTILAGPTHGTLTGGGARRTYTPAPDFHGIDGFTYRVSDGRGGMAEARVTITVNEINDSPAAVDDSATVAEDSAAGAIDVLANDTDVDGGAMTIASASEPANGTVAVTGGGTGLTYQPDANFCGPDTFTYTLNGGSTATVSVTVTCVDDLPTAVDDSATVPEDSAATPLAVLANDSDLDGDPMTIASASDPANGTVVLTGGLPGAHTGLTYQPDPNYCSATPDTFTYTLNGGSTATVSVTVTCGDDAPTAVDDSATVAEDSGASAIAVLANDTDADGGPMTIASASDPANGTVVLTGGSPGAHTGLTYQPDAELLQRTPDTFTYTLNGGSTATVSVTVTCVDDPPTAVNDSATVAEDSGSSAIDVLANDTDTDGGPRSVASVTQPANGTVVITGGGSGLTYQPDSNFCSATPDTFTYTLNGGSTATVSVTVTCVDDPPDRGQRHRNGARGLARDRDRRARQRHRHRRRAEGDRVGVGSGERDRGPDRRLAGRAHRA